MKTFDGYCFDEIRFPSELSVPALKTTAFIDEKKNLVLYDNVGTWKTHLATAIGIEACNRGKTVRFFRTAALVNKLNEVQKSGEISRFSKQLAKTDLLICDGWGYVPLDQAGSKLLFQVISDCYEQRSVIITTNLEFSKWVNAFYDEQMTATMIHRLVHHGYPLRLDGQSHRIKNSLMRDHSQNSLGGAAKRVCNNREKYLQKQVHCCSGLFRDHHNKSLVLSKNHRFNREIVLVKTYCTAVTCTGS